MKGTVLKFSGKSDDIIVWEFINPNTVEVVQGEIAASATSDITRILVSTDWSGHTEGADKRSVYVFAIYDGCWHFSVRQTDQGRPIPSQWEITIDQMDGDDLSARICIDTKYTGDCLAKPIKIEHNYNLPRGSE